MALITALLVVQWMQPQVNWLLFVAGLFGAVPVAVMAHNHNHLRMWRSDRLNALTDYWITCFYGYPTFGWIPTHNANHHKHNNKPDDYTLTYRYSEANNLVTLLTYPTISGGVQQKANFQFMRELRKKNPKRFAYYMSQLVVLFVFVGVALAIDWKKALLYIVAPQQFSLNVVLIFNYIQHVHADEMHEWNHSRNFTGRFLNFYLLNNGYHTVHHEQPGRHWSEAPAEHAKIAHLIDPSLNEKSFWWYMLRNYVLGLFIPSLRTKSMRLARLERERAVMAA